MLFFTQETIPQITEIKLVRCEVAADLYVQTYGRKNSQYIQAATSEKVCKILENAIETDLLSIYFDSLYSLAYNEKLEIMLRFACIKGIAIYSKYM